MNNNQAEQNQYSLIWEKLDAEGSKIVNPYFRCTETPRKGRRTIYQYPTKIPIPSFFRCFAFTLCRRLCLRYEN